MKILGIVAGRHGGNSEILTKEALLACQKAGAECTLINLFDYNILPCTGCETCTMAMGQGKDIGCVLDSKDDMKKIVDFMQRQDAIIIGCPVYDLLPQRPLSQVRAAFPRLRAGLPSEDRHREG